MPAFIVLAIILADLAFFRLANQAPLPSDEFIQDDLVGVAFDGALAASVGPLGEIDHEDAYADFAGFLIVGKSSLIGLENPVGGEVREEDLLTYKVKNGDTLSSIAKGFGISVDDILEANDKTNNLIKPGEELAILPVSKSGSVSRATVSKEVTDDGYFARPVAGGGNWGALHDTKYMPAIDISKACGSSIFASADGTVVRIGDPALHNSGYGGYILLSHENGSRTIYAHTSENLVEVGDMVNQGDLIAKVGNTGTVHGSTGCHVHFGVTGAPNPFAN